MFEQYIPLIAAAAAFAAVLMALMGFMSLSGGAKRSEEIAQRISGRPRRGRKSGGAVLTGLWQPVSDMFGQLGARIGPKTDEERRANQLALIRAGIRRPDGWRVFQGAKAALTVVLAGGFLLLRPLFFEDLGLPPTLLGAVGLAAIGCYAPDIWLRMRTKKRAEAILNALPDALDLLVVCVESGMGLDQAITRVCNEMRNSSPEISLEFYQLTLELRAGRKRTDALRDLGRRCGVEDLNSLISLLVQADTFGISVGRTLRVYSDTMRTKRFQLAEEKAAKLPVLLLLPLILFILPALFVVIMGPAIMLFIDVFAALPK